MRQQIFAALKDPAATKKPVVQIHERTNVPEKKRRSSQVENIAQDARSELESAQISLREVYYLVLLYIGVFLKNMFLALSVLVQPRRVLMPTLLAKYNITFLDALGRQPRILPFEYFRSYRILEAFIQEEFKNLPGSGLVKMGNYRLFSRTTPRAFSIENFGQLVKPGTTILMSMVTDNNLLLREEKITCPATTCPGSWERSSRTMWVTW